MKRDVRLTLLYVVAVLGAGGMQRRTRRTCTQADTDVTQVSGAKAQRCCSRDPDPADITQDNHPMKSALCILNCTLITYTSCLFTHTCTSKAGSQRTTAARVDARVGRSQRHFRLTTDGTRSGAAGAELTEVTVSLCVRLTCSLQCNKARVIKRSRVEREAVISV